MEVSGSRLDLERYEDRYVNPSDAEPGYLTWRGLAQYSSCSKRWLQAHVPHSLRFRLDGKVLVRVNEFDRWMERHRLDLHQLADEILGERESSRR